MTLSRNLSILAEGVDEDGILQPSKGGTGQAVTGDTLTLQLNFVIPAGKTLTADSAVFTTVEINGGVALLTVVTANNGEIGTLTADSAAITALEVNTLVVNAGSITAGTFGTITADSGTITSLNAGTIDASVGTIDALTGTSAAFAAVNAGTVTATIGAIATLTGTSATITTVNAGTIDASVGTIDALTTGTLDADVINTGSVAAAFATASTIEASVGTIDSLTGTIANYNTVAADTAILVDAGIDTATMDTAAIGTTSTFTVGDLRWSPLFSGLVFDKNGAPLAGVTPDGKFLYGYIQATNLSVTKADITDITLSTVTATTVTTDTLSVDGNKSEAGDPRWGLFGAVIMDKDGNPIGFVSKEGTFVFGSARINTLALNNEPSSPDHAATKKYVDETSGGTSGAYTGVELQARDALALAQSMAVRDQINTTIASPAWEYSHAIGYGQSFTFGGSPLISTVAGPTGTFSFGARPANTVADDTFVQAGAATIQALTTAAGLEAPILGTVNYLRDNQLSTYNLLADATRQLVVNSCGKGGTPLEDLSKGATPEYYAQITDLAAKTHTAAGSDPYGVFAILLTQGESNYAEASADNTEAGYKTLLETFATDVAADMITETSQTKPPGLFLCQTSSAWDAAAGDISAIGNAQLAASLENPNIYLIGPYYAYPDDGTNHLTSNGYRWLGEQFGKVIHKVAVKREGWMPCHIKNAWFRGDKILLEYHVPEPPLQIQPVYIESTLTTFANLGYRIADDTGSISALAIEVLDSTVVITMSRTTSTADNPWIQYAGNATYSGAGNICDSDPTVSYNVDSVSGDPYPLYNWAVGQRITLVEDV